MKYLTGTPSWPDEFFVALVAEGHIAIGEGHEPGECTITEKKGATSLEDNS